MPTRLIQSTAKTSMVAEVDGDETMEQWQQSLPPGGGCPIPAFGWAACAGLQAGAFAARSANRIQNQGWNRRTRRAIVRDGAWSAVTLGWGRGAGYLAKYGTVGRRFWNGRCGPRYSRSWSEFNGGVARRARSCRTYGPERYRHALSSAAIASRSITYAYGRYGYGRWRYGR